MTLGYLTNFKEQLMSYAGRDGVLSGVLSTRTDGPTDAPELECSCPSNRGEHDPR